MATGPDRPRVLHLDDDEAFLDLTKTLLGRVSGSFTVETATDPEVALERVRDGDVACLLTDYDMPEMNGLEVLRAVREHDPSFPVILYTGKGSEEVAAEAIAEHVTEYVQKEAGRDHALVLANRVENAIRGAESERLAELRLEAIDASREGIAIFHADGTLAYANPAYRDLYDYDLEEATGEPWRAFHPDHEVEVIETEVLPEVELAGEWQGEGTGVRRDGDEFAESKAISRLPDGGFVVIVLEAEA